VDVGNTPVNLKEIQIQEEDPCKECTRQTLLVVEPNYVPDLEVLAFSRVYTP
jgi:hypothetical protein